MSTDPTAFSHVKPQDTAYRGEGLRDFFLYRDLGIAAATARSSRNSSGRIMHRRRAPAGTVTRPSSIS